MLVSSDAGVEYLSLNLAVPPFDDVHVRRAVNLAVDKATIIHRCCVVSGPASHYVVDNLTDNLLASYAPYATPGDAGDIQAARAEMALSRYDVNGDGRCGARVSTCRRSTASSLASSTKTSRTAGPGSTTVTLAIKAAVPKGSARLELTLVDGVGNKLVLTRTIRIPARGH